MDKTMFDKIWDSHVVHKISEKEFILYVDLHLIHEVTSPQAFDGIRLAKRTVRRPDLTLATTDHNTPTINRNQPLKDKIAELQLKTLAKNCKDFGITLYDMKSPFQGIVHVIAPEQGLTHPGKIIVCGDSHTSTHGAFGTFAIGIGTSEVEHVFATQTIRQFKPKTMQINLTGSLPSGISSKDCILWIISQIGISGAREHVVEYTGNCIESFSMESRMTLCNMSIEAGARAGMIAPDNITFEYLKNRKHSPNHQSFEKAVKIWSTLKSDPNAKYDKVVDISVEDIEPMVTWGTNPGMSTPISGKIPELASFGSEAEQLPIKRALQYMNLEAEQPISEINIDRVFIGSCTNSRIEDLRIVRDIVAGYAVNKTVQAMVVPGSTSVKKQAENEGIDKVIKDAGFEWRDAGCSMCLGMNEDVLKPYERCASTSNRNFEGRQGHNGRTHLVSPAMAAASAIKGHFTDIRSWKFKT
tara:strand:- start:597 stop:2006 length:1410 start_codon:yes stop_codon:yes gene_type:complete